MSGNNTSRLRQSRCNYYITFEIFVHKEEIAAQGGNSFNFESNIWRYLVNEIVTYHSQSSYVDHFLSNNLEPKHGFSEFLKNH